jgi:hypothetical protein
MLDLMSGLLGAPNDRIWPGLRALPHAERYRLPPQPYNYLRKEFPHLSDSGIDLLNRLLCYDPDKRITARQALRHPYFTGAPARLPRPAPSPPLPPLSTLLLLALRLGRCICVALCGCQGWQGHAGTAGSRYRWRGEARRGQTPGVKPQRAATGPALAAPFPSPSAAVALLLPTCRRCPSRRAAAASPARIHAHLPFRTRRRRRRWQPHRRPAAAAAGDGGGARAGREAQVGGQAGRRLLPGRKPNSPRRPAIARSLCLCNARIIIQWLSALPAGTSRGSGTASGTRLASHARRGGPKCCAAWTSWPAGAHLALDGWQTVWRMRLFKPWHTSSIQSQQFSAEGRKG